MSYSATFSGVPPFGGFWSKLLIVLAAVKAQQQIVRDCEKNLATHRQRWMVKRQKLESLERVREQLGLNEPLHIQYLVYMRDMLGGDWGTSIATRRRLTFTILSIIGIKMMNASTI